MNCSPQYWKPSCEYLKFQQCKQLLDIINLNCEISQLSRWLRNETAKMWKNETLIKKFRQLLHKKKIQKKTLSNIIIDVEKLKNRNEKSDALQYNDWARATLIINDCKKLYRYRQNRSVGLLRSYLWRYYPIFTLLYEWIYVEVRDAWSKVLTAHAILIVPTCNLCMYSVSIWNVNYNIIWKYKYT